jgi:low affinity Fe/Cu permease
MSNFTRLLVFTLAIFFSIRDAIAAPCGTSSTITSNFNGTPISGKNFIWFNSHFKVSGLTSSPTTINIQNAVITFSANSVNYSLSVPKTQVVFSKSISTASTSYDVSTDTWMVKVPYNTSGDVFAGGLAFPVPAAGLPGGINPVSWTANFGADASGLKLSWQWSAAVYSKFSTDYNALGVSALGGGSPCGTPVNFKSYAIGGARGGGAANTTGSNSATATIAPALCTTPTPPPPPPSTGGSGEQCFVSPTIPNVANAKSVWTLNTDGTVTIRTTFAKSFVDNTYGTNAIGWSNGHKFGDLVGSDHVQLALYDASGAKKMEFKVDYISSSSTSSSGYTTLGVNGGDGKMILGNASDVVSARTSLSENFNTYKYVLTSNSPATDDKYTVNSTYPNWIYDVWYEVTVKQSVFGSAGFGYPAIASVHASPSKTGNNTEVVNPGPCPGSLTLGNQVWNDRDGDGKHDPNEEGISGITVSLYTDKNQDNVPDGPAIATTNTDVAGRYQFTNLTEGHYIASIPVIPGYQPSPSYSTRYTTSPNPDNDVDDDNNAIFPNADNSIVYTHAITLTAGKEPENSGNTNNTFDLALCGNGGIGDFVWNDLNGNGIQDAGEPGINGVKVIITFQDGTTAEVLTHTYNATNNANAPQYDGYYDFINLGGGTFKISFETPSGLHPSPAKQGNDDTKDSDPVNGSVTLSLPPNGSNFNIDAGFTVVTPSSDGGGQQCFVSPTIPTIANAKSTWKLNADGTVTIRTTFAKTFVDNTYGVNSIGWGSKGHKFGDLVGSDHVQLALYDGSGTKKMEFKLDYITSSSSVSSGYTTLGVNGGDGKMIVGSASDVVGVKTSLSENFNTYKYILTSNSPATDTNYTPNSSYPNWIYDVWYEVTVNQSVFGTAGFGYPAIASVHASPSKTGNNTEVVNPGPCPGSLTLGNQVWNDRDGDGHHDPNEEGISGLTVRLYTDNDGDNIPDGAAIMSTKTDVAGKYQFTNLTAGRYIASIPVIPGYQPSPSTRTSQNSNPALNTSQNPDNNVDDDNNAIYPNADRSIVYTHAITLTEGGEPENNGNTNNTFDLALCGNGGIGDFVWNDLNGNGIQDAGEPGINGVKVTITFQDGTTDQTYTDTYNPAAGSGSNANAPQYDGYYNFINLGGGTFKITFETPSGLHPSPAKQGNDDTKDSDPVNGVATVTLAPNSSNFNVDAGFTAASTTGGGGQQCFVSPTIPNIANAKSTWKLNADGTVTIKTTFAKTFVDNTYGTNAVGWNNGHKFNDLVGSDHVQLALYDAAGTKKMEFKVDYISSNSSAASGYTTLGVNGGDGKMILGSSSDVVGVRTSLSENFNTYNYVLTSNSPATDDKYTVNSTYPNWIYDVWYEVTVNQSVFGTAGFGYPAISSVHASPSKTGNNSETVEPGPCPGALTLGNQVWNDRDGDGKHDTNEEGINGITVSLYTDNDGDNKPDGPAIMTTKTDVAGRYKFTNLPEGRYIASIPVIPGYQPSPSNTTRYTTSPDPDNNHDDDNNAIYPNADNSIVYTHAITLTEGDEPDDNGYTNNTLDLALCGNGGIGDFVWNDLNGNGIQDKGEPGINGVKVTITFEDGTTAETYTHNYQDYVHNNAAPYDGYYDFINIGGGTFKITFETPAGLHPSPAKQGNDDTQDSDPVNGVATLSLDANTSNFNIDAGFTDIVPAGGEQCFGQPTVGCQGCAISYPDNSNLPRSAVAFNESDVLRLAEPGPSTCGTPGSQIKLWYNDEHAMILGVRRVIVKTNGTTTTTDYPVTPTPSTAACVTSPLVGTTTGYGDQSGNDLAADGGRPLWPALFITDLTVNGPTSRAGDWQQGGVGIPPHKVCGTWKSAVRTVDYSQNPPLITVAPDADPARNNWDIASTDQPAGGFSSLRNEGYGAEVVWNVDDLGLLPGHTYRLQFMVHDGDQNKVGGDAGESCTTVVMPGSPSNTNPIVNAKSVWNFNPDQTITIRTTLAKTFVDNTYGANAIGWPSGHDFASLNDSDNLQLALYDAAGNKQMEFAMDYFSPTGSSATGYQSLGVSGGDGAMITGRTGDIVSVRTAMDSNFNDNHYVLTNSSPATDGNYSQNSAYPKWDYNVWYEVTVKQSAFGSSGFGYPRITKINASPSKTGNSSPVLSPGACPPATNQRSSATPITTTASGMIVYPNPAASYFNVKLTALKEGIAIFKLIDATGNAVIKQSTHVASGTNTLTFNLTKVAAGIYNAQLIIDGQTINEKVMIAK